MTRRVTSQLRLQICVSVFAVACMLCIPVVADDEVKAVNENCPVSKEPIDGKTFIEHEGKKVGFCCPGCDRQFNAWSKERKDRFVAGKRSSSGRKEKATQDTTSSANGAWTEPYSFAVCAVSGELLGSMGDPVVKQIDGREYRFCCKPCVSKFKKCKKEFQAAVDAKIIEDQLPYYPLDKCLVSGAALIKGGKDVGLNVVVGNRLFRVANDSAKNEVAQSAEKYVEILNAAAAENQRPEYPLEKCVVAGGKLGSMGDPTEIVVAGRLLRFCCGSCEPKVLESPAGFIEKVDQGWKRSREEKGRTKKLEVDASRGQSAFNTQCASCHFVPDPTIRRDRIWTEMLETTA